MLTIPGLTLLATVLANRLYRKKGKKKHVSEATDRAAAAGTPAPAGGGAPDSFTQSSEGTSLCTPAPRQTRPRALPAVSDTDHRREVQDLEKHIRDLEAALKRANSRAGATLADTETQKSFYAAQVRRTKRMCAHWYRAARRRADDDADDGDDDDSSPSAAEQSPSEESSPGSDAESSGASSDDVPEDKRVDASGRSLDVRRAVRRVRSLLKSFSTATRALMLGKAAWKLRARKELLDAPAMQRTVAAHDVTLLREGVGCTSSHLASTRSLRAI